MKRQTLSTVITHLLRAAFFVVLLVVAIHVMPGVLAQRLSKEALKAGAATQAAARADVPLPEKPVPQPSVPTVCTLDGTLGTAPVGGGTGNLAIRLFRGGVVTTCASAPYPGTSSAGTYVYNVHYITNSSAAAVCTMVTLHYVSGGTATVNFQVAAFQAPFAAADISSAARYLGDPGSSSGGPPLDTSFSVNVPPGATIGLVVFNVVVSPAGAGAVYQLLLDQNAFCGPPAPIIVPAGSMIVKEGCVPPNGAIDPGETVTVDLKLMNNGALATTNLGAALQPGGGVTNPSGPQNYGVIVPGGMATGTFTFTADSALPCGSTINATLQLSDGGNPLPSVTFAFVTGALVTFVGENFDGVVAPVLPPGWTSFASGIEVPWVTSTTAPFSAPNEAFAPDPSNVGDTQLISPTLAIPASGAQLKFKNNYNTESTFDGEVLEISINGGAYADIITAGGTFVSGAYNGAISTSFASPIAGRQAWNGNSGGYVDSVVDLPPAANGQNVQLKWRMASDNSVSATGVMIDDISIARRVCCVGQTDHFKAYQLTPTIPPLNVQVTLKDQFDLTFEPRIVLAPFRFANPVQKFHNGNITPITNPTAHLELYNLNPPPTSANRIVNIYNQFGEQRLLVRSSRFLAVPSQKNSIGQVENLDHFKCYDCVGTPLTNVVVDLTDQFHLEPQVQVLQPVLFCNPVIKIHNGTTPILHPADHLVFYAINPQPPFQIGVGSRNQFTVTGGQEQLQLREADLLGVPSLKQFALTRAVSRMTHGTVGDFDVDLPLDGNPGVECRTGGATGDFTLVLTFADNVAVNGSPQADVTMGTGAVGTGGVPNGGMVMVSGNVVTIPLTNVGNAQYVDVTLHRVNSVGNVVVRMGVLLGDTTGDGVVNSGDSTQTKNRSGQTTDATNFRSDVNKSGGINSGDSSIVKSRAGTSLP